MLKCARKEKSKLPYCFIPDPMELTDLLSDSDNGGKSKAENKQNYPFKVTETAFPSLCCHRVILHDDDTYFAVRLCKIDIVNFTQISQRFYQWEKKENSFENKNVLC